MNISLKRILSFVLAFVLVVGMLPANALSVWAADGVWQIDDKTTTPTKAEPTGDKVAHSVWVLDEGPKRVCKYASEHTHTDDCYKLNCDHKDGHLKECYSSATSYSKCTHSDNSQHTGYVDIWDLIELDMSKIATGDGLITFKDHEATPIARAVYDDLFNNGGCSKKHGLFTKKECKGYTAIINHYNVITDMKICYTTAEGDTPICGHVCSEVGGACYTKSCWYDYEHKHVETLEESCWEYHWTLKADANDNGQADDAETKYTIKYVGMDGAVLQETKSIAGAKTPAYTGATPVREFYTFKDWGTVADKVTGDATYVATWTPIKDEDGDGIADEEDNFTISWDNAAGTWADGSADAVKTETKNYGESLTAPGVVAPKDHVFSGWSPAVDKVTKTVTYVAQYTKDSIYTITYKVDGNTYVVDGKEQLFYVNATDGEIVPSVAAPSKDGYVFTGWTNSGVTGTVPTADVTLEATWAVDANRNGVADGNETAQVTLTVSEGGTATLTNGGNDKIIITNNGNIYTVVYDSTTAGGDKVVVSTTVNDKPATNQAYYLKQIVGATEGKVEVKDEDDKTVTVTFGLEVFTLPDAPQGGYVIEVNGFDNSSMANGLKEHVLDAIFGEGKYNINDYKVEMRTKYTIDIPVLGSYDVINGYYNVDGVVIENVPIVGTVDIPASWFVTQLKVDNSTLSDFKITKLAASNDSKTDLYIENVMIKAKEVREKTEDITLGKTDYTADTLEKLIADIKNNVLVNGAAANVTVTLAPAEQQLGTNKQTWTATITAPATAGYLESSKEFTITATINSYSIKWDVDGVVTEQKLPFGTAITTPATPSKEGHTFAGWKGWTEGATAKNDVTYTAEWTINTYTVTWTVNGETFTTTGVKYGEAITAPSYDTPAGHTFHGWQNIPSTMPADGITIDASLTVNKYDVIWVWQNAEGEQTTTVTLPYGTAITVPAEILKQYQEGDTVYTITGWTGLTDGATVPVDGITYTATYTTGTAYIVDFNSNGGSEVVDATVIVMDGETAVVARPADPAREGYRFDGWYLNGKAYDFATPVTGDITITAKWVKQVTVSFDGAEVDDQTFDINGAATEPADPIKGQAIFGGWYLNGIKYDFTTPVTEDITLVAEWIADINRNNVPDKNETITITQTGNGSFTVIGAIELGDGKYLFDTTNPNVTITVTPVVNDGISASYVASINGAALTYGEGFVATANLTVANSDVIEIVLVDVPQINSDKVVVDYNFFTKVIPYGDIYNAVISTPAYKNDAVKYTYFARPAMKHTVSIDSLDLDSSIKTLLNTIGIKEFSFDMEELWLPLDAQIEESVDLETAVSTYLTKERINGLLDVYNAAHDKAYDDYIAANGNSVLDKIAAETAAIAAGGKAALADIQAIYDVVYASAMYYGAHNFGYNATGADTVDELIRIEYTDESMHWTTDATVTLKDPRESAFISGSDQTLIYRDYTDEELLAMFGLVDANGNPIEGAVYSVQLSDPYTFEGKNVSETVYELTVKFAGNEDYRAAEKTFNITVVKATASIDVPNVNTTFGDLLPGIDVTMGNKYGDKQEILDSLVQIIIGLDLDELEITPDGKLEGIGTRIQIMLPKDDTLATIFKTLGLDVYGEEGVILSLGELQGYLDQLDGLLGSFDSGSEMVDGITNILQSVTGLVDLSNVEITFGGQYPTDIGVYVYGAVSTSGNYETAYDVGYIVIKPDTTKVYLDWNKPITNSVLNLEALKNFDLGATAFDDELFANLNAEATKLIINLYLGIDLNGKTYLTADPTSLGNGAYIEIAFIYDIGNEMYYAVPIVRPVVVAPDMVDVELKDQYGNTTNDMVVDFNNKGQSFDIFINGELANDNDFLTVYYIGVQSNGQFYHSTEKPVHAGVYTAIAVYAEYMNEDGELTIMNIEDIINGIIDGLDIESIDIDQILATLQSDLDGLESFGINAGVITILPVESNVTVEDKVEIVEPNKQNRPVDQVIVGSSADANLRPDSTIISAGIASNGTFTENGWSAVYGNVNIDFPAWVDAILAEYVPGIADGITVAELSDMLSAKLPAILAVLEEKGASNEVLNSLTNAINNVLKVLNEIPGNTTLTFESDIAYTNVGAYVIVAIVTDSDHIPSIDAGFLVIRPNVTNVELEWNYEDDNNLFTRDLLEAIDYDLWAKALANGVFDKDATAKITYQFIGVNADGEFVIYTDPTSMPNGAYIQLAYIAFELDGQMYISDMIARPVVIAPSSCKVEVDELHTEFDNTNKDVTVTITDLEGNVIDITKGELTFVYAGLQANGQPYLSATAPKHAGVYEVIVVYVEYDENGAMRYYGAGVGALVIDLTDSTIDVTGGNEEYNGNGYTATVIPGSTVSGLKPDFTLISGGVWYVGDINAVGLSDLRGNVNIDFPKWFDAVIAEYEFADGINPAYLTRFINAYRADMIAQVEEAVDKLGANVTVDQLNAYIDELLTVLAQLPSDAALSFNDNMSYSEVGYYFYYGIITDSDHKPSTDTGVLVIEPTDISDIEATDTVYNGYEQTTTLTVIGANGAVLTEGIDFAIVSGNKATNAGTYTVTIQGIGNYTGEYTVEWTIEKAKVTVTVNDATKVYGENDPIFSAVISGLKINDTLNVSFQRVEGENVGEYVISAYASDDNYDITFVTGKLTITKASVVVDVNDATKVYGSADPAFSALVSGLKFNDQLNITFTREEGENVGKYVITASASDDNYDITFVSGVLTITKANVTINVEDAEKVYGSADPTFTATVNGLQFNDKLNIEFSRETGENVGQYIIKASAEDANYNITVVFGTLSITKANITINVEDAEKIYGSADPAFSALVSGLKFNDQLNITFTREEGENVGKYVITASASDANYDITFVSGVLTITKANITINVEDAEKVYGSTDPTFTATVNGLQFNDKLNIEFSRETGENVGQYIIKASAEDANYNITVVFGTLTITKASVVVDVNDATKVYGSADPAFSALVSGLKFNDVLNITFTREPGENVGEYVISATASNANYNITVVDGTFTITAKQITDADVALNGGLVYNGNEQGHNVVLLNGITADLSGELTGKNAGKYVLTVTGTGNYAGSVEMEWAIAKKAATIAANNLSMVAGNIVPGFTAVVEGVVDGETLNYTMSCVADGKTAGIYDIILTLGENSNYDVTVINGKLTVKEAIAKNTVTGIYYAKLQDAIDAVKNGETIVFLTNIDEDVTIQQVKNVKFTIDGANYKYFGTMIVHGTGYAGAQGQALTIQNINFMVDGYGIYAYKNNGYARDITVDGCSFTGSNGSNYDYGIALRDVYNTVVKNTTGANLYDLVYGNAGVNGFTAENIEVINSKNGIWLSYVNGTATFTNVTTAGTEGAGVGFKNLGAGTVTFNNCDIDRIEYSEEGTKSLKLIFNDTVNNLFVNEAYAHEKLSIVLNQIDTTVTAIAGLKASTTVNGYRVVYENGKYFLADIDYVAQIGDTKYESIQAAVDAAQNGDTIVILKSHVITSNIASLILVDGKSITIDLNGKTLTANIDKNGDPIRYVFRTQNGATLTVENGTVIANGDGVLHYMFSNYDSSTLTIVSGNYTLSAVDQGAMFYSENSNMSVQGGNFIQLTNGWMFNTRGNNAGNVITVSGGTFNRYFIGGVDWNENTWEEVQLAEGLGLHKIGDNLWTIDAHIAGGAVIENNVASDCVGAGSYDIVVYCTKCGAELSRETIIVDAHGHTAGAPVREEHIEATLDAPGCYDMVIYCQNCGAELSREHVEIPQLIAVAKIGETLYLKLQDAIDAVKNGETIVFLTNIDEDVTIQQVANIKFTIDGANYKYFGTMIVHGTGYAGAQGQALTIKNINFVVDGYGISANVKSNFARNITVDGCTFTGTNGTNYDYGMILHSVYNVVVKNTTGTNLYDLVYGRGSVNGFTAENVEVINSENGIWLTYPTGTITFIDVTTAGIKGAGVGFKNNASATVTFNYCNIDRIEYSEEGNKALKLIFNDTMNNMVVNEAFGHKYLSIVLNQIDTTVTAIAGLNATTTVKGYRVVYENGKYLLAEIDYVAQIGDTKYESIQAAVDAAQNGDTIVILKSHEIACDVNPLISVAGKKITIDLNGKTITANAVGAETVIRVVFQTAADAELIMTDSVGTGAVVANGEGVIYYMFRNEGSMTIKGGNYTLSAFNGGAMFFSMNDNMFVEDGNFTQTTIGWMFNTWGNGEGVVITVSGGTFNRYFIGGNAYGENEDGEVAIVEGYCLHKIDENLWTIKAHKIVTDAAVDPTCTETGLTAGAHCSECGEVIVAQTVVAAKGHTEVIIPAVDPTFNTVGWTEGKKCSVCGQTLIAPVEIPILGAVAQNIDTGDYYTDVSDALAAAKSGETVILLVDGEIEAMLMVPAGVTFNLNGHYITAGNVFSFGNVIDNNGTTDGKGGIKISNDRTKAFVQLQQSNTYLPLYDKAEECYRFFYYELSVLTHKVNYENTITFRARLRLSSAEAYKLLADTANSGVEVSVQLEIKSSIKTSYVNYVLTGEFLAEYAQGAYDQVFNGEKAPMAMNKTLDLTLTGLDSLESGTVLTIVPTVTSEAGVSFEKYVVNDRYTVYIIP